MIRNTNRLDKGVLALECGNQVGVQVKAANPVGLEEALSTYLDSPEVASAVASLISEHAKPGVRILFLEKSESPKLRNAA